MSFRLHFPFACVQIFFDLDGRAKARELGEVGNSAKGADDGKTLDDIRFVIGDYLDVAIHKEGKRFAADRSQNKRGGDREDDRTPRERKDSRGELDWEKAKDRPRDDRGRDRDRERERDRVRGRGGRNGGRR